MVNLATFQFSTFLSEATTEPNKTREKRSYLGHTYFSQAKKLLWQTKIADRFVYCPAMPTCPVPIWAPKDFK